jgi:hypothetical protein
MHCRQITAETPSKNSIIHPGYRVGAAGGSGRKPVKIFASPMYPDEGNSYRARIMCKAWSFRVTYTSPVSIILPYNFASPIILNTFAAIAEALAKAVPPSTGRWILHIVRFCSNARRIWPYSSMDRTEVS